MSEFSNRVEAQRQLLKVVNARHPYPEPLFALTTSAIERWRSANLINANADIIATLFSASSRLFFMANNSDGPITGEYQVAVEEVEKFRQLISDSGVQ